MSKAMCALCSDVLESQHRHDFVRCGCGKTFIDGGDDYHRAGGYLIHILDDLPEEEFLTIEEIFSNIDQEEDDNEERQ